MIPSKIFMALPLTRKISRTSLWRNPCSETRKEGCRMQDWWSSLVIHPTLVHPSERKKRTTHFTAGDNNFYQKKSYGLRHHPWTAKTLKGDSSGSTNEIPPAHAPRCFTNYTTHKRWRQEEPPTAGKNKSKEE